MRECLVDYEQSSMGVWLDWWLIPRFARSNLTKLHNKVANLSSLKQDRPCPQKPNSSFEAYAHKTCTTTRKIDIKTRQKHRYNTSPICRSIFFPRNYTVVHLFSVNNIDHLGNSKLFAIFCALCMIIDPHRKRFVMNSLWSFFYFQKSQRCSKKSDFQSLAWKKPNWQPCYTRIENAHEVRKKLSIFFMYRSPENLVFLFPCWDIMKCLNASMLKAAVFELVQQFYHATEFGNVASTVSTCADQP